MVTGVLAVIIVGVSVLLSLVGLMLTRRFVDVNNLQKHHDVAGFIIAILGVIYGVLQAFVVFVVWSQFDDARSAVEKEATSISDLYRMAYGFPPDTEAQIRSDIRAYTDAVVTYDWPAMAHGEGSEQVDRAADRLWATYETIDVKTNRESALYQESISRLNDASNSRRIRILASRGGIPDVMWVILIFGGLGTIAFTYFFGVENGRVQACMTALLTAEIALVLFLVAALQFPFDGDTKIQPDAFIRTHQRMAMIEKHEHEKEAEKKLKAQSAPIPPTTYPPGAPN